MLIFAVSCTGTIERSVFEEESPGEQQEQEVASFSEVEFRFAMTKLENGDYEGTRETLTEIEKREDESDVAPKVAFALGVLRLLEMEDLGRMRACRDYFQNYADEHPGGPYRENAEQIVRILDTHINWAKKEEKRIKELSEQVSNQEKVIQTLNYKIEKLEEIHQETERKRHLIEGE